MNRQDIRDGNALTFLYNEVQGGGPFGQFSLTNGKVTRQYDIPVPQAGLSNPTEAWEVIRKAFLGYGALSPDGTYTTRLPPLSDPTDPSLFFTAITRIEPFSIIQRPDGRDDATPSYSWRVTLQAEQLSYDPLDDAAIQVRSGAAFPDDGQDAFLSWPGRLPRYVTVTAKFAGRLLVFNKGLMKTVEATPVEIPEGIPVTRNDLSLSLIWHAVPQDCVPFTLYQAALNRIDGIESANHPAVPNVSVGFFGFRALTLLLESVDFKPYKDCLGGRVFDVTLGFRHRLLLDTTTSPFAHRGWNYVEVVRGGVLKPLKVTSSGLDGGSPPFLTLTAALSKDFRDLFRPPS